MVDRWVQDHQKDAWRKQAKASGYRARSAFRLKQIQDRHKIVDNGDSVLDVGCHPGGWAQVGVELVGLEGKVVGVDLQACVPVEGANLIVGDITEPLTQQGRIRCHRYRSYRCCCFRYFSTHNRQMGYRPSRVLDVGCRRV